MNQNQIIETAAKRGAELATNARPLDVGTVANAATRAGEFTDPTLDPETGLPAPEPVYWLAGMPVGSAPIKPR